MERSEIDALYRKYGPSVLRRARSLLGDEQAARDAMQEVFIRALKAQEGFRGEASPMTWLYRITTNYCLNLIRDSSRRAQLLAEQGQPATAAVRGTTDERLTLRRLLRDVDPELQEIAVYYFVDQLNQDEIAELVGVSRRTVGYRLEAFKEAARAASSDGQVGGAA
jgi:RNA polymerase sigma-70 factor (ECF subfamily)